MVYGVFLHGVDVIPSISGDNGAVFSDYYEHRHGRDGIKLLELHDAWVGEGDREPGGLGDGVVELAGVFVRVHVYYFDFLIQIIYFVVEINKHWIEFLAWCGPAGPEIEADKFFDVEEAVGVDGRVVGVYEFFTQNID